MKSCESNKKIANISDKPLDRVIIFTNGNYGDLNFYKTLLKDDDYIICADGGTNHALDLGIIPNLIIGDLDSISSITLNKLQKYAIPVIKYPSEKNYSDLELAVDRALNLNPKEIVILGALGSRFDHTFGNVMLLTSGLEKGIQIKILDEIHEIFIADKNIKISGSIGDYLSLYALTPEVKGVKTMGLKYQLKNETLYFASTRGLSNEFTNDYAEITISQGYLLIVKVKS
jgi:thiamine pyrophosphokinase